MSNWRNLLVVVAILALLTTVLPACSEGDYIPPGGDASTEVDLPQAPSTEPETSLSTTAQNILNQIAEIEPSEPAALGPLLYASQDLDEAINDGSVSEDEAEDLEDELTLKFSAWVRAMMDEIDPTEADSLKDFFDMQAIQELEEWDKYTDPETRQYKEEQMTEKFSQWIRSRMDEIDPTQADHLKLFFWMQAIQATEKWDKYTSADAKQYKEEQMREKFNEWVRNRMDEIDPTQADHFKYFFWMQAIQETEKYEEYATPDTHEYKEEQMGEKFNEWVRNRVNELDPNDPNYLDELEYLRIIQYTEKYEKYVTAETHAYKEQQLKQKYGDYITNLVNSLNPIVPGFMQDLHELMTLQNSDIYNELCPEEVKLYKNEQIRLLLASEPGQLPHIVGTFPENGQTDVPLDQPILIAFDQPMMMDSLWWAVDLLPQVEYTITLMDDYILLAIPLERYEAGTTYTFRVGPPAITSSGMPLQEDNFLQFTTVESGPVPRVLETTPVNGQFDASPGQTIEIYFSQPMNPASVESGIETSPTIKYAVQWLQGNTVAVLQPLEPLEFNTTYTVSISPAVLSATGVPLEGGYDLSFFTGLEDPPEISGTSPADGQIDIPRNYTIEICFERPMDTASVEAALEVTPNFDYTVTWRENNFVMRIIPLTELDPFTTYSIVINVGAKSDLGIPIEIIASFSFTTGK